jgi:uncharacterized protein YbaR (Trm112 family)
MLEIKVCPICVKEEIKVDKEKISREEWTQVYGNVCKECKETDSYENFKNK